MEKKNLCLFTECYICKIPQLPGWAPHPGPPVRVWAPQPRGPRWSLRSSPTASTQSGPGYTRCWLSQVLTCPLAMAVRLPVHFTEATAQQWLLMTLESSVFDNKPESWLCNCLQLRKLPFRMNLNIHTGVREHSELHSPHTIMVGDILPIFSEQIWIKWPRNTFCVNISYLKSPRIKS